MTGASDQAMWRPDGELVATVLLELSHIVERASIQTGLCSRPDSAFDRVPADSSERRGILSPAVSPEDRVRNVNRMVRIQRHVNIVQLVLQAPDHRRQSRY